MLLAGWMVDYASVGHTVFAQEINASGSVPPPTTDKNEHSSARRLLGKYCGECHSGETFEGDFDLAELSAQKGEQKRGQTVDRSIADLWEQVANALADDYMPPDGSSQPSNDEKLQIIEWVKSNVAQAEKSTVLRRMNRVEYENTIRDLFQLKRDAFANPDKILRLDEHFDPATKKMPRYVFAVSHFSFPDAQRSELLEVTLPLIDLPAEHGYTNDVEALQFSPLIAEKYIQLGREIPDSPTLPVISDCWESLFLLPSSPSDDSPKSATERSISVARNRLRDFLRRAFRRPVTETEVDRYVTIFAEHFASNPSFTDSMKATVATILVSPDFLFLFQSPQESLTAVQRESTANASRLSYFLWASMPDQELLDLADQGKLSTPEQLHAQAKRMMRDRKVRSLSTDFGMQWLKVNRLKSSQPDVGKYPDFYVRKKQPISISMMIEQMLFFETVLVEDLSILSFIHSDFAYLNRDLLYWYGCNPESYVGYAPPNSAPEDFFRVKFPETHLRGGAITAGSTLVLTSTTHRTSPVFRGAWVSETIFNRPPPPPPPNVPALEKTAKRTDGKSLSVRQRLDLHRQDPNCYSCHARIDPLGFGLEQFDAVGKVRKKYDNGDRIDSVGEFDGQTFNHAYGMKRVVLSKKEVFARAFVEHLLRYAVNRKLTLADSDSVDEITTAVIASGFKFHTVVEEIVKSSAFRASLNEEPN